MLHSVAVMRFAVEASHDGRLNHDQEQLFYSFRADWLAGHVRLELRNVVAKYPFERSLRFPGIQQNSDHRDYSPLSCGVGWTQLGPRTQGITEETATPWGRPESFSIEGARRLRSSGAPRMSLSLHPGHASGR